jgi:DNA-binding beta-propeller fold protein YncE
VGQGSRRKLYVYDYLADSCLKVIDISAVEASYPDACVFSATHRRAYVSSFQFEMMGGDYVGIIDTDRDTLLRVLPVRVTEGLYRQVAVDDRDGKVYIADCDDYPETPDTMWVVDCATDSVLKKFECVPAGHTDACIRWVPWSNRIYLVNIFPDVNHNSALVVIDCATDSIIVPGMLATGDFIRDIQLDPIRQRIFVVGADSYCVYVLRDMQGGVAEEPAPRPAASATARICPSSGGVVVEYQLSAAARVRASLHDAVGRRNGMLDAGQQNAGLHQLSWNRDQEGRKLGAGAYFVHLDMGKEQARLKAVVR